MKRFQECNKVIQIWRYRWYILIPFQYLYYSYIKPFKVGVDEWVDNKIVHTEKYDIIRGKNLLGLLKGIAQGHMNWYYTSEEVFKSIKEKHGI